MNESICHVAHGPPLPWNAVFLMDFWEVANIVHVKFVIPSMGFHMG